MPLLDLLRRGELTRDIKMLAAKGALVPRPHEQLALLVALVEDADPEVRLAATETLDAIPRQRLSVFLTRADVSRNLREFFAARGVHPADVASEDADRSLLDRDVPDEVVLEQGAGDRQGTLQRLAAMSIAERVKVGMKGTREQRAILIRNPNRVVAAAVLSSPKLTETEVESFAKMANVAEEVLRVIGNTRAWVKNYAVTSALTRNPKTPLGVGLTLLNRLRERDLKMLATDRNVQESLRTAVQKRLSQSGKR